MATLAHTPDALDHWARRITAALNNTVESIFATGAALAEARAALAHGEWERLFAADEHGVRKVPMSVGTARKFIEIHKRRDSLTANRSRVNDLPSSWGTLYQLAALPDDTLTSAIDAGLVRPDMQRKDVAQIKARFAPVDPVAEDTMTNRTVAKTREAVAERVSRVAELAARGASVPQIADEVGLAEASARNLIAQHGIDVPASRVMGRPRRLDPNRIIDGIVVAAEHLVSEAPLIEWSGVDHSQVSSWLSTLRTAKAALSRFINRLEKEQANAKGHVLQSRVQGASGEAVPDAGA